MIIQKHVQRDSININDRNTKNKSYLKTQKIVY